MKTKHMILCIATAFYKFINRIRFDLTFSNHEQAIWAKASSSPNKLQPAREIIPYTGYSNLVEKKFSVKQIHEGKGDAIRLLLI
jgi:hypothetical protein